MGKDTPQPIFDNAIIALIIVGLDVNFCLYFPRNANKLIIDFTSDACILFFYPLIEGLISELAIMDRTAPVLEFLVVQVS